MPKSSNNASRAHKQKLESNANRTIAPSLKTPDGDVAAARPPEARTAPRQKTRRSNEAKQRPANKATSKTAPFKVPKLPFEFADQRLSESVIGDIQSACALGPNRFDSPAVRSMMSVMISQKPKDPFALMLLLQMSGLNGLVMDYLGHLRRAKIAPEIEMLERTLNKLARTFAGHIDVYHRWYRSGGEHAPAALPD